MEHHKGSCPGHSQGDAPHREGEPTRQRVPQHHSRPLDRGAGRLVRLVLVGCLLVILAGGALLLQPRAVQAATQAPTLGHPLAPTLGHPLAPMVAVHPSGDDDDDDDDDGNCSFNCSVVPPPCSFNCSVVPPPCSFSCSPCSFDCSPCSFDCSPCSFSCSPCSFSCSVVPPVCKPVVRVVQVPVLKTVKIIRVGHVIKVIKVVVPVTKTKIVLVCG
jgi:hypothetical protein